MLFFLSLGKQLNMITIWLTGLLNYNSFNQRESTFQMHSFDRPTEVRWEKFGVLEHVSVPTETAVTTGILQTSSEI